MALLRDIFILQVVRLVLTYNFSNCNFKEISNIYSEAIYPDLKEYLNGNMLNQTEFCDNLADCLMKIEYHTLNPIPGCPSLPKEMFALKTRATLINQCPGYSETQRNNPQEMKQEVKNICLNQTSQIQGLWKKMTAKEIVQAVSATMKQSERSLWNLRETAVYALRMEL